MSYLVDYAGWLTNFNSYHAMCTFIAACMDAKDSRESQLSSNSITGRQLHYLNGRSLDVYTKKSLEQERRL